MNNANSNTFTNNVLITAEQNQKLAEYIAYEQLMQEFEATEEGKKSYQQYYLKWIEDIKIFKANKENPASKKTNQELESLKLEMAELKEVSKELREILKEFTK